MLLPPSMISGVFGVNIDGIPGKDYPWAFPIFCIILFLLMPMAWLIMKRLKWM